MRPKILALAAIGALAGCSMSGHTPTPPAQTVTTASKISRSASRTKARVRPNAGPAANLLNGYANVQKQGEALRLSRQRAGKKHGWGRGGSGGGISSSSRGMQLGNAHALVLYDTSGQYGFLGELYAMAIANLCGHFGSADMQPVTAYTAGEIAKYNAVIYAGSTYYDTTADPIPAAFYTDVIGSSVPVIWMNDNIWNFADAVGPSTFSAHYGWDPTTSYFAPGNDIGNYTQVIYKNQSLTRMFPEGTDGGILHPTITNAAGVSVLATALDAGSGTQTPWMIRSANLTYIGEIPFEYVSESDRIIAFEDVLFDALAPSTPEQHRALVRLEDLNATDDPAQVKAVAQYLYENRIPYGFNVIPQYEDPLGYYNNGVPLALSLKQSPSFVKLIQWLQSHGGTPIDEGYTHQYSNIANPYSGVSGDDAEFFLAHVDAANNVVWDGPIPQDSTAWATSRVTQALAEFTAVHLQTPQLWVTPHYYASAADYQVFTETFAARYDRPLYFSGYLSGQADSSRYIGEFYPYVVNDVYGGEVIPENLGDYEPVALNNHPIRLPADIVHEAQLNLAVRDGFASFFYDPSYGVAPLQQTVEGIKALGYTFVAPTSLLISTKH